MPVEPIPEGYSTVTPYLIVDDGVAALDFYRKVFRAEELMRMPWPGGRIGHAEFMVGDTRIMLASEFPEMGALSPKTVGGSPVTLALYTENVDELFARALAEGATEVRPLENQFYGDRQGVVKDPFGHTWSLSTHLEDVSPEELARRQKEMFGG